MPIKIRPCIKRKYDSEEQAKQTAVRIRREVKAKSRERKRCGKQQLRFKKLSPYPCRWCGQWHLTSQKQRK